MSAMKVVELPYGGERLHVEIPRENLLAVVEPADVQPTSDPTTLVLEAASHPVASAPLRELVKPKQRVLIIIDDLTRPTPQHQILPPLLQEIQGVSTFRPSGFVAADASTCGPRPGGAGEAAASVRSGSRHRSSLRSRPGVGSDGARAQGGRTRFLGECGERQRLARSAAACSRNPTGSKSGHGRIAAPLEQWPL